jgi:hypothetical protein
MGLRGCKLSWREVTDLFRSLRQANLDRSRANLRNHKASLRRRKASLRRRKASLRRHRVNQCQQAIIPGTIAEIAIPPFMDPTVRLPLLQLARMGSNPFRFKPRQEHLITPVEPDSPTHPHNPARIL